MVMDKGMSVAEAENFCSVAAQHVDYIKLGFGSAYVSKHIDTKINIYKSAGMKPYFGGTLFEAFLARNQQDDFLRAMDYYNVDTIEVSDGSISLDHDIKCEIIQSIAKNFQVLSEVGSKDAEVIIPPQEWIALMQKELQAGAFKVIAEAREGGNVGIFRGSGEVRSDLINEILRKIPSDSIIWEAPNKSQQVYFIKLIGANVNLGNISVAETIPLETLRIGLRGDTFNHFLV